MNTLEQERITGYASLPQLGDDPLLDSWRFWWSSATFASKQDFGTICIQSNVSSTAFIVSEKYNDDKQMTVPDILHYYSATFYMLLEQTYTQ